VLTGVVARYFDAWNDRDPRACGECFAPDGVREWRVLAPLARWPPDSMAKQPALALSR